MPATFGLTREGLGIELAPRMMLGLRWGAALTSVVSASFRHKGPLTSGRSKSKM